MFDTFYVIIINYNSWLIINEYSNVFEHTFFVHTTFLTFVILIHDIRSYNTLPTMACVGSCLNLQRMKDDRNENVKHDTMDDN